MPEQQTTTVKTSPYDLGRRSAGDFSPHVTRDGALDYAECGREAGRRDVDEFWTGVADELEAQP